MGRRQLFRRIFSHAKWRCLECYAFQETRLLKPKGWVKKKTKDGNTLVFCSQKCKEEWFGENTRTCSLTTQLRCTRSMHE